MTIDTRQQLLGTINSQIKLNGTGAITGPILNNVLDTMVNSALFQTGAWSQYTSYAPLDIAEYAGNAYIANVANVNIIPSTDPNTWTPFSSASAVAGLSGYIQYNNGTGGLAASSNLTFDGTNLNAPVTPTGTTTARTLANLFGDIISVMDFGAVGNGTTNDTSAVLAAISTIGSSEKTLLIPFPIKINSNLTFGSNTELWFLDGGKFIGTSGTEVITVQKQIVSGLHTCFSNCAPISATGMTIYPEWFGAVKDGTTDDLTAFQKAFSFLQNVGGLVQLQAGYYAISDELSISYSHITIQGAGNNTSWIKVTGTNKNGVKINGVSGTPIRNIMLRDFSIILNTVATASSFGLNLNYTAFAIVERMQVQNFLYGVNMEGATNSQITKVGATYTGVTLGFIGFLIYGGASGATGANASSILKDCYSSGVSGLTGQIGFKLYGSYMSDVQLDTCETALTNYGYYLEYGSAPNYNVNIIIRNPIVDRYFTQGILVNGLPSNGALQIIGGYSNPDTLGAAAQNIYLSACIGAINVIGHEFMALTNTIYTDGVYMTGCSGVTISSCIFTQLNRGIYAATTGYSVITANIFRGGNPSSFTKMIEIFGGARIMVNGNSFSGATNAVVIDGTSDGCGIVGNTANVATVGTRFTNGGTNPVGGATGSTGLNSGY